MPLFDKMEKSGFEIEGYRIERYVCHPFLLTIIRRGKGYMFFLPGVLPPRPAASDVPCFSIP